MRNAEAELFRAAVDHGDADVEVTFRGEFSSARLPGLAMPAIQCPVPQLCVRLRTHQAAVPQCSNTRDPPSRVDVLAASARGRAASASHGACTLRAPSRALLALAETRLHCLTAEYGILGMSRAPLPLCSSSS
jgi:hypothetical protein